MAVYLACRSFAQQRRRLHHRLSRQEVAALLGERGCTADSRIGGSLPVTPSSRRSAPCSRVGVSTSSTALTSRDAFSSISDGTDPQSVSTVPCLSELASPYLTTIQARNMVAMSAARSASDQSRPGREPAQLVVSVPA